MHFCRQFNEFDLKTFFCTFFWYSRQSRYRARIFEIYLFLYKQGLSENFSSTFEFKLTSFTNSNKTKWSVRFFLFSSLNPHFFRKFSNWEESCLLPNLLDISAIINLPLSFFRIRLDSLIISFKFVFINERQ